jgi:hypothetical protein
MNALSTKTSSDPFLSVSPTVTPSSSFSSILTTPSSASLASLELSIQTPSIPKDFTEPSLPAKEAAKKLEKFKLLVRSVLFLRDLYHHITFRNGYEPKISNSQQTDRCQKSIDNYTIQLKNLVDLHDLHYSHLHSADYNKMRNFIEEDDISHPKVANCGLDLSAPLCSKTQSEKVTIEDRKKLLTDLFPPTHYFDNNGVGYRKKLVLPYAV